MPYGKSCLGIIEGCGQKNLAATAKSVKNGAKHRTKYIKNILGQPEQLGQEEPSRNIKVPKKTVF